MRTNFRRPLDRSFVGQGKATAVTIGNVEGASDCMGPGIFIRIAIWKLCDCAVHASLSGYDGRIVYSVDIDSNGCGVSSAKGRAIGDGIGESFGQRIIAITQCQNIGIVCID